MPDRLAAVTHTEAWYLHVWLSGVPPEPSGTRLRRSSGSSGAPLGNRQIFVRTMSTPAVMESFAGPLSRPVEPRPDNWYPRMRSHPPLWPHHGRAHRLVASSSRTTTCAVTIGIMTQGESVQTDHLDF